MAIDHKGRLVSAYQDTCKNYKPDKHKYTRIRSIASGMLYECLNYAPEEDSPMGGCSWCKNKRYKLDKCQLKREHMNIQRDPRIEISDLASFIAEAKDISYGDAQKLIPGMYYEDCHLNVGDDNGPWSKEVEEYLKEKGIDSIEVFQEP